MPIFLLAVTKKKLLLSRNFFNLTMWSHLMHIPTLSPERFPNLLRHPTGILFFFFCAGMASPLLAATTYQHDSAGRLIRIHTDTTNYQFVYDGAGNRTGLSSNSDDYDFDGITDTTESSPSHCTSPTSGDTDNDGIPDNIEDANHNGTMDSGETDPCNPDTDGDGIWDGTELGYQGSGSPDTDGAVFHPDTDNTTTTNALISDSDGDGIPDGIEDSNNNGRRDSNETDATMTDTDHDGLADGVEDANHNGIVDAGETNPLLNDTDGDGFSDGFEVSLGMNPLHKDVTDSDGDGLVDALENVTCTSANSVDSDGDTLHDGAEDANHNGIVNSGETNPCKADTDGDGLRDDVDPEPTIHINGRKMVPLYLLLLKD
ncbi:MAG TPA: hypothetical protein ENJ30_00470 [Desulfobulbaceae bacterium]|nr:hypothetical protein [Desulfobulbaceae bacterium]